MKINNLLIAFFALITIASCSTAYKSGQTPDDVYYSPVRVIEENTRQRNDEQVTRYYDFEEREIRMAMRDRRWRDINYDYGYDYRYNPYQYGYNYGYYYNPYYYNRPVYLPGYTIVNPKTTAPRTTNLGSYNNNTIVVTDGKAGQTRWVQPSKTYSNTNRSNGGTVTRRILNPTYSNENSSGSRNNSSSNSNNSRTYSPAPTTSGSNSSGSSSSGSSSGTVTRPARGNN